MCICTARLPPIAEAMNQDEVPMLISVSAAPASTPSARRAGAWVSGTTDSSQCQTNQKPTATPAPTTRGMTIPSAVRAGKRSRRPKNMETPCRAVMMASATASVVVRWVRLTSSS